MNDHGKLYDRPRYLKEIAQWYGVSPKTMRQWLHDCRLLHTEPGYYYSIQQLRLIAERLGEPAGRNEN